MEMNSAGTSVAWDLLGVTSSHLAPPRKDAIYVHLGAGDVASAIELTLASLAEARRLVSPDLALRIRGWLEGYANSDQKARLDALTDKVCSAADHRSHRDHRDEKSSPSRTRSTAGWK
jgi:hypothetical protein